MACAESAPARELKTLCAYARSGERMHICAPTRARMSDHALARGGAYEVSGRATDRSRRLAKPCRKAPKSRRNVMRAKALPPNQK